MDRVGLEGRLAHLLISSRTAAPMGLCIASCRSLFRIWVLLSGSRPFQHVGWVLFWAGELHFSPDPKDLSHQSAKVDLRSRWASMKMAWAICAAPTRGTSWASDVFGVTVFADTGRLLLSEGDGDETMQDIPPLVPTRTFYPEFDIGVLKSAVPAYYLSHFAAGFSVWWPILYFRTLFEHKDRSQPSRWVFSRWQWLQQNFSEAQRCVGNGLVPQIPPIRSWLAGHVPCLVVLRRHCVVLLVCWLPSCVISRCLAQCTVSFWYREGAGAAEPFVAQGGGA